MRYWAFISYSSRDRRTAAWLHRRLEGYSIPKQLRGASLREGLVIGRKLRPVFRDRDELPSTADLGETISAALRDSWCLIVLCSPNAATSQWVNTEIEEFRELGRGDRIFPLIVGGEPNAARPEEECFPPALRDRGVDTLGGDLRPEGDGRERSLIKILAAILEVDFDQLYRRHERITRRRWATFGSLASALALVLGALAFYAFDQKQVANNEGYRADSNEKKANQRKAEAKAERDAARKSAARTFFERAKATEIYSHKLAWALRGIDEDPSLLVNSEVSTKLQHWLGPHAGPTSVEPTGIEWGPYSGKAHKLSFHVSRPNKRILLHPPWQRWQLYAWEFGETRTRGSVDDSLHVPRNAGKWFFVSSEKNIEARRWEDGTIVSTAPSVPGYMTDVTVVGDEAFVAMHAVKSGRQTASVYTWRFQDSASPLEVIPDTSGQRISQFDVIPTPNHDILLTWDHISEHLGWYERTPGSVWKPIPIESELPRRMALTGWKFPPGAREATGLVLELQTDEEDVFDLLVDLEDPRQKLLKKEIKGVRRDGDTLVAIHNVAVIDRATKSTKIYAEEIPLNGGRPTRLHGGEAVSHTVVGRLSGTVVSQGHKPTNDLFIRSQDGTESRRTIFPHRDPILESVEEIQPRIFVKTTRRSDDAFIVIDLDNPEPGLVRSGTAFELHAVLDASRVENGLAVTVLSHNLAGISRFDNLPSLASVETLDAFDGDWNSPRARRRVELSMLSVNNKGVIDALVGRRKTTNLDTVFQRVRSDQNVPGPRIQTNYVRNQPEVAIRQDDRGHLLLPNRPAHVLNTAGKAIWTGKRRTTALGLVNVRNQAAVLVEQRDAIEALSVDGATLWSHHFPEDSLLSTSTEDVLIDHERSKVQLLRHDPLGLVLVQLSLRDGTLVSKSRWSPNDNDNEKLEYPLRHTLRHFAHPTALTLLLSEQEGLLIDWDDNRGSVAMRWPTKVSQLPTTWFLPASHALIVDRVSESGRLDLARVSRREGGWVVNDERIELDGALVWSVFHPSRDIALLTSEEGTILWDFEANRRINTRLHSANGNAVLGAKGAIWANDGGTFFIWDAHTIRHHSSAGDFLGSLREHERDAPTTIIKAALSPSGKWIVSGDDQGRVIRTEVRTPKQLTPSELRRAVHGIGGYVIKDNGPARWKPGELTVPRAWAPLVRKLAELVRGTSAP